MARGWLPLLPRCRPGPWLGPAGPCRASGRPTGDAGRGCAAGSGRGNLHSLSSQPKGIEGRHEAPRLHPAPPRPNRIASGRRRSQPRGMGTGRGSVEVFREARPARVVRQNQSYDHGKNVALDAERFPWEPILNGVGSFGYYVLDFITPANLYPLEKSDG